SLVTPLISLPPPHRVGKSKHAAAKKVTLQRCAETRIPQIIDDRSAEHRRSIRDGYSGHVLLVLLRPVLREAYHAALLIAFRGYQARLQPREHHRPAVVKVRVLRDLPFQSVALDLMQPLVELYVG